MPAPHFNPDSEIPDLSGKVYFITGGAYAMINIASELQILILSAGTAGLGYESVLTLAAHKPGHIYFSGRSDKSAEALLKVTRSKYPKTPVTFIKCDLASLDSVKNAAKQFVAKESRLDAFLANAGVMALPPGLTKDGYEIQ